MVKDQYNHSREIKLLYAVPFDASGTLLYANDIDMTWTSSICGQKFIFWGEKGTMDICTIR